jgi:hypothetical protein
MEDYMLTVKKTKPWLRVKPLNDGTKGYRLSCKAGTVIYRKRKHKLRNGFTSGTSTFGIHRGLTSIYFEKSSTARPFWGLAG